MRPLIVAEIGTNHRGDALYADKYLESLLNRARPDALTFQVRRKEYYAQQKQGESTLLPDDYYSSVVRWVKEKGVQFGIALCDVNKLTFFERIGTDFYKILSEDIGNKKLVAAILATGKPVYISTGMSSEDEIGLLLKELGKIPPHLTFIHTQLSYEDTDTNLRAIRRLSERFDIPVAFGLHSTDVGALYVALGFDPAALFFYVKGDASTHRDDEHAIRLTQCPEVIAHIRRLESMLGDGVKKKMGIRITFE